MLMSDLPLRADLIGQTPYGAPTDAVPVRLNVNENPYPPPAAVVTAIARAVTEAATAANRYPDREATRLRQALAEYVGHGVTTDNIWAANGSNEVMHQLLGAFGGPGRTCVSFDPTYSMYPVYARDTNTAFVTAPRRADHRVDLEVARSLITEVAPSVVVVASPNNPTGGLLTHDEVRDLYRLVSPGVLVVDEAYVEFAEPSGSVVPLLSELPNLVVLRTLSKAWGLAGLRLGFAVSSPAVVDALRLVRLPYHLSSLTQAAAVAALAHRRELLAPVAEVVAEREQMAAWLQRQGIPFAASQANFILVGPLPDSHATFEALRDRGILVRESAGPGHLRVSIGTPDENAVLREALQELLEESHE